MHIPERFEEKLTQDRSLRRSVDDAVTEFEPWLRESKLPFFPDYTNHGAEHVEGILITASSLISDEAWDAVTAADAAVLVLAALLHDCAMHLTEDGFRALVSGSTHTKRIQGFGDVPWPELWQEFLFSAKRFDDRTLSDLFGRPVAVRTPPADKGELTLDDRLLIGEFVRRHHPRLAHEIAVGGVPGPTRNPIRLSERLDPELADLAGLVARSHGLPLRATFDYLGGRYHLREYLRVHAVFLMAVLRVADYLQIQAERAPRQVLQVKEIRSPFSHREWRAHHAVKNIVTLDDDPEAVLVQAAPPDVLTYLRLKDWLGGIQAELDSSWAVLGEVYGRVSELRRLGLVIRRVRSNLDDARAFSRHVEYVPRRVEFDIARSEILKLLVRPLYGDKPEIGIRELLQNSVDAVRELWDLQEQNPSLKNADLIEQEADVVMWLDEPDETGRATFTISDRGVGMTEEVITDYFLKVGASYRHSDAWAKQHERPDEETETEATLKSRVLRSGRFGIGALAAFLLGDELEVSTRHVTADKGIRFTTRLDSEPIELRYDDTLAVGTTVRVTVTRDVYDRLINKKQGMFYFIQPEERWDWYCQSRPTVLRLLGRERSVRPQMLTLPDFKQGLHRGWFEVNHPDYSSIHVNLFQDHGLACNGLNIKTKSGYAYSIYDVLGGGSEHVGTYLDIHSPFVSISDPEGNLPLNLTRDELSRDSFVEQTRDACFRYLIAYMLVTAPRELDFNRWRLPLRVSRFADYGLRPWFLTSAGVGLLDTWNLFHSKVSSILILDSTTSHGWVFDVRRTRYDATIFADKVFEIGRPNDLVDFVSGLTENLIGSYPDSGARLLTMRDYARRIVRVDSRFSVEWDNDLLALLKLGTPPPTKFILNDLGQYQVPGLTHGLAYTAAEFFTGGIQVAGQAPPDSLIQYWEAIIREPTIPFDPRERRRRLSHAFKILAPYVERIEKDLEGEAASKSSGKRRGRRQRKRDKGL